MADKLRFESHYFNGRTAVRHSVVAEITDKGLTIWAADHNARLIDTWPFDGLHVIAGALGPDESVLGCDGRGDAQLIVADNLFFERLTERMPNLVSDTPEYRFGFRKTAAYAALAVGLCLLVYFSLPVTARWVVTLVSVELEREWGTGLAQALIGSDNQVCRTRDGKQALQQLTTRLEAVAESPHPLVVRVLDEKTVNAMALPGGHIFIFSGLIKEVGSGDELAGVLAHEVGHVVGRHALIGLLETFVLDLTLGSIFGGGAETEWISDELMSSLVSLSYTREMEAESDRFAATLLKSVGVRRDGLVHFFERLQQKGGARGNALAFLSTHPPSEERAHALLTDQGGGPAMSDESWAAISGICQGIK